MNTFLLVYNRLTGQLEVDEYPEAEAGRARADRARRETELLDQPEMEVVLLGADSVEALQRTHSRYFKRAGEDVDAAV